MTMDPVPSSSVLDLAPVIYDPPQLNLDVDAYSTETPAGLSILYIIVHK